MGKAQNCWDYNKCGYGLGNMCSGRKAETCPAVLETRLAGVHGGINGGRACWMIPGTLCANKKQENLPAKLSACLQCNFYWRVREEEGLNY